MSVLLVYGFALLTAAFVIAGDYFIKLAADAGSTLISVYFAIGAVLYLGSAAMWYGSMRQITLAQAGVAYSMLTLLAVCALGIFVFGERLQAKEVVGIGCALLSMVLMVRFT